MKIKKKNNAQDLSLILFVALLACPLRFPARNIRKEEISHGLAFTTPMVVSRIMRVLGRSWQVALASLEKGIAKPGFTKTVPIGIGSICE